MGVQSWGYHSRETFWSTAELARRVSSCAARGYTYLLNVEPAPDGAIRKECRIRAQALGRWIRDHRAAVDAASCELKPIDPHELPEPPIGVSTLAGNTLYLHLHRWPLADELLVRATGNPLSARLTGAPRARLTAAAEEGGIRVRGLPPEPPAAAGPWIVTVAFQAPPRALPAAAAATREYLAGESVCLAPADAELGSANGVLVHGVNRWPGGRVSVGGIYHIGDTLAWRVAVPVAGEFEVYASLGAVASQSDAEFELSCGASRFTGRTWFTGYSQMPERRRIGRLRLAAGPNRVVLRVTGVTKGHFPDVHGIALIPAEGPHP